MEFTLSKIFPVSEDLKNYNRSKFKCDLIAGLTVASILIPQAMAYALLAGVPPQYGLYAGLIPLMVYALLASSTKMSVGPVAISSLLIFSGVSQIAVPFSERFIALVLAAGLFIGILQVLLGLFRLGFITNFLSHPVIVGFTSAAAIIIFISQIKDSLGLTLPNTGDILDTLQEVFKNLSQTNVISLGLTVGTVFLILGGKKISRSIPGALFCVIAGIVISKIGGLESKAVDVVGSIPKGFPKFTAIDISAQEFTLLIPTILTVTLIGIVESIGIAKVLEAKHKDHRVIPNTELKAIGFAKILGSFFLALPSSGSFTRSAINSDAGAKTNLASLIAAGVVGIVLIFFSSVIYFLPKSILAGIILVSVFGLFDIKEAKYLWKVNLADFLAMAITFIFTLVLGIEWGVLIGAILSILFILYKSSKPTISELGLIEGSQHFKNLDRFDEAEPQEYFAIIRFEYQLYFANASVLNDYIFKLIQKRQKLKYILLDAAMINNIDSSGLHILFDIDQQLKKENIELHLCGAIGSVRDKLHKANLLSEKDRHHLNVYDAYRRVKQLIKNEDRAFRATQANE